MPNPLSVRSADYLKSLSQLTSQLTYFLSIYLSQGLPEDGITVFASQLHTHLTGRRVRTMHIRDGLQLPDLNGDKHYDSMFQEIRLLQKPVKVLPVSIVEW